jgi:hypothetical protein
MRSPSRPSMSVDPVSFAATASRTMPKRRRRQTGRAARELQIDAALLGGVLAIESLQRPPLHRAGEFAGAAGLLLAGRAERVERLSLGIAQLQPRNVPGW